MAERTKGIAGLLAFLLGFLGAHRFYVGRDHSALWYLVPTGLAVIGLVATGVQVDERGAWEDGEDVWTQAFLGFLGLATLVVLASWVEAVRFWAMNTVRFRRLYVAWVEPTGEGVQRPLPREEAPSKPLAIVLAVLFGQFGVHRFYLRRPRSGVVLLLLAMAAMAAAVLGIVAGATALVAAGAGLLGLLALLALADAVRLAFLRERDFRHRYGKESPLPPPEGAWEFPAVRQGPETGKR